MNKAIYILATLALATTFATAANATVQDVIPIEGVLADSDDAPIDALVDITFKLYDAETSGTELWTDTFTDVDVEMGFFTVYLGTGAALNFASLLTNAEIWLGVTVESDPEMDLIPLYSVPFAIEAAVCGQVGTLTESDIVTTTSPAGGITTTNVSNWESAYGWGDHAGLYAPVSHTHSWNDITSDMPAGFADGTDDGYSTEGELTGLLDDNYAALGHGHGLVGSSEQLNETLTTSTTYAMSSTDVTLPNGGFCQVSISGNAMDLDTGDTITGPYLRTARQVGTGSPAADTVWGNYLMYVDDTTSTAVSSQYVWTMDAGVTYRFGCGFMFPPSNWSGDEVWCRVSWFCLEN